MGLTRYVKRVLRPLRGEPAPRLQLRMLRTLHASECLPSPHVEGPYRLVSYGEVSQDRWIELLNSSGEFKVWDRSRLEKEMLGALLPEGALFAAEGDRLVGCASVCMFPQYAPYACLMYVTVLHEHRSHGLGQALLWGLLAKCQKARLPGMLLHTDMNRISAIRTYLRLGFMPHLGDGVCDEKQWLNVLSEAFFRVARQ